MVFRAIFLAFWISIVPVNASGIQALKQVLQQRSIEPKMYLPDDVIIGEDIKIFVYAPGASKVELYASNEAGQEQISGQTTRLGSDYHKVAEQTTEIGTDLKADFVIKLDKEKDAALIDKFYMFEALISYEGPNGEPLVRTANYFGSNANFSNNNAVKIKPEPKNRASAASLARSMIPGFAPKPGAGL